MRIAMIVTLVLMVTASGHAQESWQQQLKKSLVQVQAGKMTIRESGIYKITVPGFEKAEVQVKIYAEAPATGVISRDNFIAFTTTIANTMFLAAFADEYDVRASVFLNHYEYEELDAPIGKADVEMNIYMNAQGYQLEVVNNNDGTKNRVTQTWKELLTTS